MDKEETAGLLSAAGFLCPVRGPKILDSAQFLFIYWVVAGGWERKFSLHNVSPFTWMVTCQTKRHQKGGKKCSLQTSLREMCHRGLYQYTSQPICTYVVYKLYAQFREHGRTKFVQKNACAKFCIYHLDISALNDLMYMISLKHDVLSTIWVGGGFMFRAQRCLASGQVTVSARFTNSEKQCEQLFKITLSYLNLRSFTWQFQYCVLLVQPLEYYDVETPNSVKLILLISFVSIKKCRVTFHQNHCFIGEKNPNQHWDGLKI